MDTSAVATLLRAETTKEIAIINLRDTVDVFGQLAGPQAGQADKTQALYSCLPTVVPIAWRTGGHS